MTIQIAVLCDAATDYNGKLNLLGTFDTIITSQLPAVHPQCSIALRLAFGRIEEGAHKVKMNFVDEDGRLVMPSIEMPEITVMKPGLIPTRRATSIARRPTTISTTGGTRKASERMKMPIAPCEKRYR